MARVRYTKNSFAVGVISQKVKANTDFEQYNNALEECVNFQVQQTGGLFKRGGSIFVAETKLGYARLVLYIYDKDTQYICEFGRNYIRFYTKYGALENNQYGAVLNVEQNPIEVVTPFDENTIRSMHTFQDGNSLVLVTNLGLYELRSVNGQQLFELTGPLTYTCEPLTFLNKADILLKPNKQEATQASPVTITVQTLAGGVPAAKYAPVFYPDDAGNELCLTYKILNSVTGVEENQRFYLRILSVTPDERDARFNKITAYIESEKSPRNATELPDDKPVRKWQVMAFSENRGMPQAAAVFEGRLFLGNTTEYPAGIWGSSKLYGDWTDFYMGADDADAVQFKIAAKHSDSILWMIGQSKLFIGTAWGIYVAGSATFNDEAITPSNFRCRLFDTTGASPLQPIEALDSVFFVDSSGKNVHEIVLSGETGAYESHDVSVLANDLTQSGIIAHTWQQTPVKTYWCAVNDGFLCSLTYLKENGIMAWTKHEIAGDNVKVEDLQCMHGDKNDLLWMVVRREVDGEFKRYIEYIHPPFNPMDQEEFKQHYVDCSVSKEIKFHITGIERSQRAIYEMNMELRIRTQVPMYGTTFAVFYVDQDHCYLGKGTTDKRHVILTSMFNKFADSIIDPDVIPFNIDNVASFNGLTNSHCRISITELVSTKNVVGVSRGGQTFLKIDPKQIHDGDHVTLVPMKGIDDSRRPQEWDNLWYQDYTVRIVGENAVYCIDSNNHTIVFPQTTKDYKFVVCKDFGTQLVSQTQRAKPSLIKIEDFEDFPQEEVGIGNYSQIYVNKVSGTYQVNGKSLYVKKNQTLEGLQIVTLTSYVMVQDRTKKASVLQHTYNWSPYDDVSRTGNVYLYFGEISAPHLANKQVKIFADGNDHTITKLYTVPASGTIDLKNACNGYKMYVSVGLPIKSYMRTTPLSYGSLLGSSVGTVGGQKCCFLHLYYSLGGKYGSEPDNTYPIPYQNFITKLDQPKSLVSGLIKCPIINSKDVYNRSIYVEHDGATSFNILSITQDVEVSDS